MNNTNIKTLKIGHRGAKGYIAENTLESIQHALHFGVNGIEIDVHLCASFHDFTLDRMTNASGSIENFTLQALKNVKVNEKYSVPTLQEVLDLIDKKCLLNIELKGTNTASKTCGIIQNYIKNKLWNYSDFIVSSFQHHELEDVFKIDKNIPLGVLTKANVYEALEFGQTIDAVAVHPNFALLTLDNVKEVQEKGLNVNTWTVNDKKTINRMKTYGVNAIISDYPDRL